MLTLLWNGLAVVLEARDMNGDRLGGAFVTLFQGVPTGETARKGGDDHRETSQTPPGRCAWLRVNPYRAAVPGVTTH